MTPSRSSKQYNRDEVRTIINLWNNKSTEEIAAIVGRTTTSILSLSSKLRNLGLNLPKKRSLSIQTKMLKEVVNEFKDEF